MNVPIVVSQFNLCFVVDIGVIVATFFLYSFPFSLNINVDRDNLLQFGGCMP